MFRASTVIRNTAPPARAALCFKNIIRNERRPEHELDEPNGDFLFDGWSGETGPSASTPLPRTGRTRPGFPKKRNTAW